MLPGQAHASNSKPERHVDAMALPQLPLTENGRKYHACWVDLAEMLERSNATAPDRAANAPLYGQSARQLAEKVVAQLPITFADNFCAEVHAPGLQESMNTFRSGARTAAARQAAGRAGRRPLRPAVAPSPGNNGNQLAQASTTGNLVTAATYSDYQTDPTSNLTLPHKAVYYDGHTTRSDDDSNFASLIVSCLVNSHALMACGLLQARINISSY
jgi:hypothetical protein